MAKNIHVHLHTKDADLNAGLRAAKEAASAGMKACISIEEEAIGPMHSAVMKAMNLFRDAQRILNAV